MRPGNARFIVLLAVGSVAFISAHIAAGQSAPSLSLQAAGTAAQVNVTGDIGSPCIIQVTTNLLSANDWQTVGSVTLLSGSSTVVDGVSGGFGGRFYRGLIPAPSNGVWIPAGTFTMGSPTNELERNTNETQHTVALSKGLYVGKTLVTQGAYLSLLNTNPSYFTTNNGSTLDLSRPVERVSWFDATNYCYRLTQQERAAGRIFTNWSYRLPTEAEWEYACRAGVTNAFYYGGNLLSGMANFDGEYEYVSGTGTSFNAQGTVLNRTTAVGVYPPNNWGLMDVTGNTWEWCQDWYGLYAGAGTDPQGPLGGTRRVIRGGAFNSPGKTCRSASRDSANPAVAANTIGFRVVLGYGP